VKQVALQLQQTRGGLAWPWSARGLKPKYSSLVFSLQSAAVSELGRNRGR